ncbi:MAG: phytanoyl-CoA dioxygenase family protein [Gammaproteobacteria bacterium]
MATLPLGDDDVRFYREQGYLVVEGVVDEEQLDLIRCEVDAAVAGAGKVVENDDVYDLEASHTPERPRVRRIKTPHLHIASLGRLARSAPLVSVLKRLIGPGVRLQTSKLNMKSAGYGAAVEWHQDWAFYPHTNEDLLAVGVMLDDMTDENGPLLVMPGSHKGPVYDHHHDGYFCGAIDLDQCDLDFSRAVALTGPAGSMSFHHVRMVHGSAVNRSDHQRRLMLYQYTSTDAWPLIETVDDIESYDTMIVAGEPTLEPRVTAVPVRLPLPPAPYQGSIYENQRTIGQRYFDLEKGVGGD